MENQSAEPIPDFVSCQLQSLWILYYVKLPITNIENLKKCKKNKPLVKKESKLILLKDEGKTHSRFLDSFLLWVFFLVKLVAAGNYTANTVFSLDALICMVQLPC